MYLSFIATAFFLLLTGDVKTIHSTSSQNSNLSYLEWKQQDTTTTTWTSLQTDELSLIYRQYDSFIIQDAKGNLLAGHLISNDFHQPLPLIGFLRNGGYELSAFDSDGRMVINLFGKIENDIFTAEIIPENLDDRKIIRLQKGNPNSNLPEISFIPENMFGRYESQRDEIVDGNIDIYRKSMTVEPGSPGTVRISVETSTKVLNNIKDWYKAAESPLIGNFLRFPVDDGGKCMAEMRFYSHFAIITYPTLNPCVEVIFENGVMAGVYYKL